MEFFDVILFIIIGGFVMFGFWFGFFHTLGSLLGTFFGAFLAARYYAPMADWFINITGWGDNISKVLMFIIAFFVINRLVGFCFWIVDKSLSLITRLPFIKSINRFFGMILGLFEGLITVGMIIIFIDKFPVSEKLTEMISYSYLAPIARDFASVLWPLLPDALKMVNSGVDYVEKIVM
ncbi:MAG: CvpA family protein [Patescibacteria group bacterium]